MAPARFAWVSLLARVASTLRPRLVPARRAYMSAAPLYI